MSSWRDILRPIAVAIVAVAVTGCSGPEEEPPAPNAAADALAEAITEGSFGAVDFVDGTTPADVEGEFAEIVFGMEGMRPTAAVDDVTVAVDDERRAAATLSVVWSFADGREWTYTTDAQLVLVEDEDQDEEVWRAQWAPEIVESTLRPGELLTRERIVPERGEIFALDGRPIEGIAREVLGRSGEATAERIEESEGRLEVGDVTGLSGLHRSADDVLAGSLGVVVKAVDNGGAAEPREVFRLAAVDGTDLQTSFDVETQLRAEEALSDVGPPSALVAIRPSTGQVLAVASGPGSRGFSTATLGQYPPGSTFKVVTSLGLLRAGSTPDTPVECPDTITVDGRSFKNYGDYPASGLGTIVLRTALANSCNTAFIGQREIVSQESLRAAGHALGVGVVAPLGVPYFEGDVPADATAVQHAASMIGQDRVLVSPLTMAAVAASVAAGETVLPTLVAPSPAPEDTPDDTSPEAEPLTVAEAGQLRSMMEAVVAEGSGSLVADLPGPPAAAKTGTAEYGTAVPPRTHAWMIAIHGDLAVSVFVEDGPGGSTTAGPILERFLRAVF